MTTSRTILLVDDERPVLDALGRTLRGEGYRLLTATRASQALELLETESVDLVVSDIDMPEMDGVELIKRVRDTNPEVVRVLLTGDASLESALQAINAGEVHRYLTKPWDSDELRTMLRDAFARLDELRNAAAAGQRAGVREMLLCELEREHPGIREVVLVDGTYPLDLDRLTRLAADILEPTVRSFLEPHVQDMEPGSDPQE